MKNHLSTKANLKQIVERLTEIGLEVESVKSPDGADLDNFIICKVVKSQKHPNADKLKLCDVDIGKGSLVKVSLWSSKCKEMDYLLFMPLQEQLFQKLKMKLKVAKIRGVESFGMLCSGNELNQSSDKDGIIELNKKEKNIGKNILKILQKKL